MPVDQILSNQAGQNLARSFGNMVAVSAHTVGTNSNSFWFMGVAIVGAIIMVSVILWIAKPK